MDYTELKARDGSQTWRLRYGNRSLRWFERQTGLKIMSLDMDNLGMEEITALVAAGLIHDNPAITLDDADDVIDAVGMYRAYNAAMERMQYDLADDDPDKPLEPMNGTARKNVSGAGRGPKSTQPVSD